MTSTTDRRWMVVGAVGLVLLLGSIVAVYALRPGASAATAGPAGPAGNPSTPAGSAGPSGSPSAAASRSASPSPSVRSTARTAPTGACGRVSPILVPACGAWLGIWPRTRSDGTMTNDLAGNLTSLESRLGRPVDLVSRYYGWGQLPPDQTDRAWRDSGHFVLIDLRARNFSTNQYVSWSSIAAGGQDTYLKQVAASLKAFGAKVFFSFNQEPEQELEKGNQIAGTAVEYAAAYRHIHAVFAAAGASNVVYVWWTMGCGCHLSWYHDLYPGDAAVDWVGYDPYNFNTCHSEGEKTAAQSITPFLSWLGSSGLAAGKPVMLSEFGANGPAEGNWYRAVGQLLQQTPRLKAAVEFDSAPGSCDTRVTASADDWAGYASMAALPYLHQPHR